MFPRTLDWKHHSPSACHTVLSLFGVKHFNSSKAWMKEKNPWSPFQVGVGSAWSVVRGQLAHPWASPSLPLFLNYETVQYIKHTLACSLQCQAGKIFFFIFFHLYIWSGDFCSIGVLVTSTVFWRWREEREAAGWIAFRLLKPALVCSGWRWREILRGVHPEILMCRLSSSFIAGGLTEFNPTVHITNEYYSFQALSPDIDWFQRSG